MGLNKIVAEVDYENDASRGLFKSFGFTEEAYFKHHRYVKGAFRDSYYFALMKDDFIEMQKSKKYRF